MQVKIKVVKVVERQALRPVNALVGNTLLDKVVTADKQGCGRIYVLGADICLSEDDCADLVVCIGLGIHYKESTRDIIV